MRASLGQRRRPRCAAASSGCHRHTAGADRGRRVFVLERSEHHRRLFRDTAARRRRHRARRACSSSPAFSGGESGECWSSTAQRLRDPRARPACMSWAILTPRSSTWRADSSCSVPLKLASDPDCCCADRFDAYQRSLPQRRLLHARPECRQIFPPSLLVRSNAPIRRPPSPPR